MENKLMTIENVRGYIDNDGTAYLNLEDVSRGLGFTEIAKSGNECVKWSRVRKYLSDFNFIDTSGDGFIPENIFYRLAMKAKNETAEKFQAKVADEILPTIRKTGSYQPKAMSTIDILVESAKALQEHEQQLKAISARQEKTEKEIQGMRDVVSLSSASWRRDTSQLISRMARQLGGNEHIKDLRAESYQLLDERLGVCISIRLANLRCRMAQEGISRAKRDKTNFLDVIDKDKKLIEGYVAIVKEMAIKYGIAA